MLNVIRLRALLFFALLMWATGPHAATVADTLPYQNTPDWTDISYGGTAFTLNNAGTETLLTTANNAGVWFGEVGASRVIAFQRRSIGTRGRGDDGNKKGNYLECGGMTPLFFLFGNRVAARD